ncbi:hypothetical protein MWH28_05615 [Natroniella sulfidigena]|uniref:PilX N-terminal domain-containing pilus assembly protein n=1 Tax=Natroniella sulfidigena TaxID=723921 RepID=UPI002009F8DA|nr:PilX N-terminal domain-containing pilus assembly protein [Natroniella sulfidigena]MCK8816849.1 hypothetical protein [Natroniella sulfidigena]
MFIHREEGSVLLLALLVMVVLTVLVTGMSVLVKSEIRLTSSSEDYVKAFYIAEAGVERAFRDIIAADGGYLSENVDGGDDLGAGNYKYNIEVKSLSFPYEYKISSDGELENGVTRRVELDVEFGKEFTEDEWDDFFENELEDISVASGDGIIPGVEDIVFNGEFKGGDNLAGLDNMISFNFDVYKTKAENEGTINDDLSNYINEGSGNSGDSIEFSEEFVYVEPDENGLELNSTEKIIGLKDEATIVVVNGDLTIHNTGSDFELENIFFIVNGEFKMKGNAPNSDENGAYIYAEDGFNFEEVNSSPHYKYNGMLMSSEEIDLSGLGQGNSDSAQNNTPEITYDSSLPINYDLLEGGSSETLQIIRWDES